MEAAAVDGEEVAPESLSIVLPDEPPKEELEPNLCRILLNRLEDFWRGERAMKSDEDEEAQQDLFSAMYRPKSYLRRRAPDEIEMVLTQLDHGALEMVKHSFMQNLDLPRFAEAIVRTGTYDAERVLAFVAGIIDLHLEVLRSQRERAAGSDDPAVNWAQFMNHFIESPEIAMFEGNEVGAQMGPKNVAGSDKLPQVQRSTFVDAAKHMGSFIHKIYWMPSLEMLTTVEGTESVYFWSPTVAWDVTRQVTPVLPPDFSDEFGRPLWTVLAVAWDNDAQDLVALLSNRLFVVWRLRNREKGQFQQKRELRFNASRAQGRNMGENHQFWKVHLTTIDPKTGEDLAEKEKRGNKEPKNESQARRERREARLAQEAAQQLDVWWNASMKCWVTGDVSGKLFLWDLREQGLVTVIKPTKVLMAHSKVVTSHLELSKFKFTTCSLDRSIMLWDIRNLSAPEVKIEDVTGSVLSQAYLPLFSSLVTVGCEKRVYVWSIDSTAYRGVRAKLSAHQANLLEVSAGQRVFFTLDEACTAILWDGATLASLQTVNVFSLAPRHAVVLPSFGRICLAGRRLNFFDGNEQGSIALGAAPTKEQLAKAKRLEKEGASLKDRAVPRWCGLAPSRGSMISATEAEVRLHSRISPGQSRAIFNAPEGDSISCFSACDALSFAVLGTAKGAIYFLKYRSGFALKVYPGRREDMEEWSAGGGGGGGGGGNAAAGAATGGLAQIADGTGMDAAAVATPVAGNVPSERAASPAGGSRAATSKGSGPANDGARAGSMQAVVADASAGAAGEESAPAAQASTASGQLQNSPTAEDLQKGLSSSITCVVIVEEQRRVYIGTGEGRVIIFSCDRDYPVLRWVANPDDASAVTCIHVAPWAEGVEVPDGEEPGLMAVGTQDGIVHIYSLANLRLAGSVNILRAIPEGASDANQHWGALRQIRMINHAPEPGLPITLLTVDSLSRVRFWGLKVHVQSGHLKELKLVLDAGQLQEGQCVPPEFGREVKERKRIEEERAKARAAAEAAAAKAKAAKEAGGELVEEDAKAKQAAAEAAAAALEKVPEGNELEGQPQAAEARFESTELVRFTAICSMPSGPLHLPVYPLDKQPYEGPTGAAAQIAQELEESPYFNAKLNKAKDGTSDFFNLTQPQSTTGIGVGKISLGKEEEEVPPEEFSGSDTDGDDEELTVRRFAEMPQLPKSAPAALAIGDSAAATAIRAAKEAAAIEHDLNQVGDGDTTVYMADSGGWIWCVDIAATLATARAHGSAVAVALDAAMVAKAAALNKAQGEKKTMRGSLRGSSMVGTLSDSRYSVVGAPVAPNISALISGGPQKEEVGMLVGPVPRARPEAVKIIGAWPAHTEGIASLVCAGNPSTLISVDNAKEVKVWSSTGDIWGHFSLRSVDGNQPATAVWPPPQVLAAQMSLMRMAKGLCRRMGFHVSESEKREAASAQRKSMSKTKALGRSGRSGGNLSPSEQAAARRAAKQKKAAAREAAKAAEAATDPALGGTEKTIKPDRFDPDVDGGSSSADGALDEESAAMLSTAGAAAPAGEAGAAEPAPAEEKAGAEEVAEEEAGAAEEEAGGADSAAEVDSQAPMDATTGSQMGGKKRRAFTNQQMREMIRNHAFSSGFTNYKQFATRPAPATPARRRADAGPDQLDLQRASFFGRSPSAFGVEIFNDKEGEAWDTGVRTLGKRSASEGALLKYAQSSADDMTRSVKHNLGVDVTTTTRRMIKKPSFVQRLDIGNVSSDPTNPSSATAQAVKKLVGSHSAGNVQLPLLSAGNQMAGGSKRGSNK
mmetsp:Transcript_22098/g.39639  ORF Transcript_22098/g.39639 Transcript_22098/m.39639 type:complete len:1788 (+) Transcript_22098:67-5430(+)